MYAPIHDLPPPDAGGPAPKRSVPTFYVPPEARLALPPDPVTRSVSPARAIRRIVMEGNPTYDARRRMEAGLTAGPADRENTTALLLNSIGYTGNTVNDFNAAVDNVNKTFEDLYGYAPTPGLVLDMLRSPVAHSRQALMSALTGAPMPTVKAAPGLPPEAPGASPRFQFEQPAFENQQNKAGLAAAMQLSVAAQSPGVLLQAVTEHAAKQLAAKVDAMVGSPQTFQQTLFTATLPGGVINAAQQVYHAIQQSGVQPYELKNNPAANAMLIGENLPIVGSRGGGRAAQQVNERALAGQLNSVAAMQQKIKSTFKGITLPASGVWTSDWQKVAIYMQSNKKWQNINRIQQAANFLGYTNTSVDAYAAVDAKGNIADPQAQSLINRAMNAEKARNGALHDHWWSPLAGHILAQLPAGVFASGGTGGRFLNINLGATVQWIAGGSLPNLAHPTSLLGLPGEAESTVRNSVILAFDGMSGAWTQGKADIWAATMIADPAFLSSSAIKDGSTVKEAVRRLETDNPTWLKILGSVGTDVTKNPHLEQATQHFAATHPGLDAGLNLVGDLVVGSLVGGPEFSATDMASYARMYRTMGRDEFARILTNRNPVIAEGVDRSFSMLSKGGSRNVARAGEVLDATAADRFLHEPRFSVSESGGISEHPFPSLLGGGEVPKDLVSLSQLVRRGTIDKATYRVLVGEGVGRGQLFDTLRGVNIPKHSGKLVTRVQGFGTKGRLPILTVHPLRWAKSGVGRTLYDAMDTADRWLSDSARQGEGLTSSFLGALRHVENWPRVQLSKIGNAAEQPVALMDASNVRRIALKAGMTNRKAYALERLFQTARGSQNGALLQKVEDTLNEAFVKAGHEPPAGGGGHIFSTTVNAEGEAVPTNLDSLEAETVAGQTTDAEKQWVRDQFSKIRKDQRMAQVPQELKDQLAAAKTDAEREAIQKKMKPYLASNTESRPNLTTQMLDMFSVPAAFTPRTTLPVTSLFLHAANDLANRIGTVVRRSILASYPGMAYKHSIGDGLRFILGQWQSSILTGGPVKDAVLNRAYVKGLDEALARNPDKQLAYSQASHLNVMGELNYDRYDMAAERGAREAFMTGKHLKDPVAMNEAAAYVDRLVSDGAYRAYKDQGPRGVYDFYHTDPKAILLAAENGLPTDIMAALTLQQLAGIEYLQPGFLDRVVSMKQAHGSSPKFRATLAKRISKEQVNIPVAGRKMASWRFGFDNLTGHLISTYLKPNKFYRGTLFQNVTARVLHDMTKAGMPEKDALDAAIAAASKTVRYHMFDFADGLQIEQTLRWSLMFFTKHRLYWRWLRQTIGNRPYLAGVVNDVQGMITTYNKNNPNSQPGSIDFHLPLDKIPMVGGEAKNLVGTTYRLPLARLLWLSASSSNPGALSTAANNLFNGQASGSPLWKAFAGATNMTVLGPALQELTMYAHAKYLGGAGASDAVMAKLDPIEQHRFQAYYDQMQASYMAAHNGRPMPDKEATTSTLLHLSVLGVWQSTNFTGAYPTDPKRSTENQAQWNTYNSLLDPKRREAYRLKHPWIDTQLGMYSSSPRQWTLSFQMWAKFNHIQQVHDENKAALLSEYKSTGTLGPLFGAGWHAEGRRYAKDMQQLKNLAGHMGATDWLAQFNEDPMIGAHTAYASMLHELYPAASNAEVHGAITKKLDPPQLRQAKTMLAGLTDGFISGLPPEEHQAFYESRAYLTRIVSSLESAPTEKVSKLRYDYFKQVYDTYASKSESFLLKANAAPNSTAQSNVYEHMRQWEDSLDKPVMVDGVQMPSPIRAKYALLPNSAKLAYRQSRMVKN